MAVYVTQCLGGAATNTYGDVITAPGGSLTSFTFEVNDNGTPASYVAEVYAWGGSPNGRLTPARRGRSGALYQRRYDNVG
jgi:hypothetical protein